jgi:excinuclease ABC subunit B
MNIFKIELPFQPKGDQPNAIKELSSERPSISTLLGVTGSGKTFTIANVIQETQKQTIIISPNKTLAAQLYEEFSLFFPKNKICYFVSYYDYYQPESYLPANDIYIPKETKINQEIDRMRIETAASIVNRKDTIVIASVSCIYSIGNPADFKDLAISISLKDKISQNNFMKKLIEIEYKRDDINKIHGTFQVFPETIEIILPYQREILKVEFLDNKIARISWLSKESREEIKILDNAIIFPAKYFVTTNEKKNKAIKSIAEEFDEHINTIINPIYKERLENRIGQDLELIRETGTCQGIENYSAHFEGRKKGEPPFTLFDFFEDPLIIIDESHLAIPQLRAMYNGDQARKKNLIDYGFRLPSAMDNRPLKFEEIEKHLKDVIFVSATPGEYELTKSKKIVEQLVRPTGITDPKIEISPRTNQLKKLLEEIRNTSSKNMRTLVTVLTRALAEELAEYLEDNEIKVCYIHHEIKTPQRTDILHRLRTGEFECLVGINLLREGLDLPEVGLVAIMDADIESFLRDKRSLIQTIGRAARNTESKVIFFADKITKSMQSAIDETNRRREAQIKYNIENNIIAKTVSRDVKKSIIALAINKPKEKKINKKEKIENIEEIIKKIELLEKEMLKAADKLDFKKAIELRKDWKELKNKLKK